MDGSRRIVVLDNGPMTPPCKEDDNGMTAWKRHATATKQKGATVAAPFVCT